MLNSFVSLISLIIALTLIFISIKGHAKIFTIFLKNKILLIDEYKSLEFIIGLIFLGSLGILINFFINISDIVSLAIIFLGIFFYLLFFIRLDKKNNEFIYLLIVIVLSSFLSFYSLANDDFDYHYKIIENYKKYNVFEIVNDGRRIGYNSHWLFLSSLFYVKNYPVTIYSLLSLLYSSVLLDFFINFKKKLKTDEYIAVVYSALVLVFLIGVLNIYKDFGTDFPGQVIILLICLIYLDKYKLIYDGVDNSYFFLLIILSFFIFTIKITNILIFILLFLIFIKINKKIYIFLYSLLFCIPSMLWIIQNFIITKCFIWPLYFSCFDNIAGAKKELYWIKSFAKSYLDKGFSSEEIIILDQGFNWLSVWTISHIPKILETYLVYFILTIFPVLIYYFYNKFYKIIPKQYKPYNILPIDLKNPLIILIVFSFCSISVWFIQAPSLRFGFSYILNFILCFYLLFWIKIIYFNKVFFSISINILLVISISYFLYKNIFKTYDYIDRYGSYWPNTINNKFIYK